MTERKYPHLFEPIILGNTYFRNRLFAAPQGPTGLTSGNYMTEEGMAFYERKAQGGFANVCIGDAIVDSKYANSPGPHIKLDSHSGAISLTRLANRITRHGAVASLELNHCAPYATISARETGKNYGAYSCLVPDLMTGKDYLVEEMPEDVIEYTIKRYAQSALACKRAGFGHVLIHGGHGWLISEFVSPKNNRKDMWGGSLENRMRFPVAVADAIKKACGKDFAVEIRISGSEVHEQGYDIDYGVKIAEALDGHVDMIHVSASSVRWDESFVYSMPDMFSPDGRNVPYAAEIKKHVKTPVATVGSLSDPEMMEEIIASGKADVVYMARQASADPDLPKKALRGEREEIRQCLRCSTCYSRATTGDEYNCSINPEIGAGLETVYDWQKPTEKKKVVVIGGGIAGMQAALTAKKRGHDVILLEKSPRLGGVLRCEDDVPFKKHLRDYLDYQERHVLTAGIDVRLSTEATPELVSSLEADAVICAPGSLENIPPIPGIDGENVCSAQTLYPHPEKAGQQVVILGGGLVGTELALFLAMQGKDCTVLEMAPALNFSGNGTHGLCLTRELNKYGVKVLTGTKATEIRANGVCAKGADGDIFIEADTVVTAMGMRSRRDEALAFKDCAVDFWLVGDARTVRTLGDANRDGYHAALEI